MPRLLISIMLYCGILETIYVYEMHIQLKALCQHDIIKSMTPVYILLEMDTEWDKLPVLPDIPDFPDLPDLSNIPLEDLESTLDQMGIPGGNFFIVIYN